MAAIVIFVLAGVASVGWLLRNPELTDAARSRYLVLVVSIFAMCLGVLLVREIMID